MQSIRFLHSLQIYSLLSVILYSYIQTIDCLFFLLLRIQFFLHRGIYEVWPVVAVFFLTREHPPKYCTGVSVMIRTFLIKARIPIHHFPHKAPAHSIYFQYKTGALSDSGFDLLTIELFICLHPVIVLLHCRNEDIHFPIFLLSVCHIPGSGHILHE